MEQYAESGNTIEFKKMQRKLKREAFKRKVTDTAKNFMSATGEFIDENKAIIIPIAIGAGTKIVRDGYRQHKINKESRELECRFYDRRTDSYSWSKRPLKPKERLILEKRYSENRERKSEILREMGLLKY